MKRMYLERFQSNRLRVILWLLCASAMMGAGTAHAQYTGDFQTNIISGVTVDWTGTYAVGSNAVYDFLGIDSGGALISDAGAIGYNCQLGPVGNDAVSVSGSGSIWSNRNDLIIGYRNNGYASQDNSLTIANGGAVYNNNATMSGSHNAVVVTGKASVWNSSGSLTLGQLIGDGNDSVTIADGGMVIDDTGYLSYSSGHVVLVTGSGSVWSNRNDLTINGEGADSVIISNGGAVYDENGSVQGESGNKVLVMGTGSIWCNRHNLDISGLSCSVIISNGGAAYSARGRINGTAYKVLVTGSGSAWRIGDSLSIGSRGSVTIADEGVICAGNVTSEADITISGGGLYVTNGLGTGALQINENTLTLNNGTVTADSLIAVSVHSHINFNGGMLSTKATTISNRTVFTAGDGISGATFILDSGGSGFHSFANGLTISSNATLKGTGTIVGSAMVNGGGVLAPGASPGSMTFSNSLTLAPNSIFAVELNGSADGQYDQIVTLGTVCASNSVLSLSLGYTPSAGDTFTIISNLGPCAVFGMFVDPQGDVLLDNATFVADGTTFEINYAGNADGQDVILTAVVPEPVTWLLTVLGIVALFVGRRLRRSATLLRMAASSPHTERGPFRLVA